jgi:hypothetical protein
MHRPRTRRAAPALIALAWLLCVSSPALALRGPERSFPVEEVGGDLDLRRWFGAEAGFVETACWNPGTGGNGCHSLASASSFEGAVSAEKSNTVHTDPDGSSRMWPSRTGLRHFHFSVPGGLPTFAHLTTLGGVEAAGAPVTLAFGLRFHTPPLQPVVIYRQVGAQIDQTVMITLTPEGRLAVSVPGFVGLSSPLTTESWHAVSITYGAKQGTALTLRVDDQAPVTGELRFGGPAGQIDLGIVSATSSPFALAIDDYVESGLLDAPLHKARINYLMPLGKAGPEQWEKVYPIAACRDLAENWQLVSENQYVFSEDAVPGIPGSCGMEGGGLTTSQPGVVDDYHLEGVPSKHKPVEGYARDVTLQPGSGSNILGARLRMRARTEGKLLTWSLGYVDQGLLVDQPFSFNTAPSAGYAVAWGPTQYTRPQGQPWSAAALNGLRMRLNSGTDAGVRHVSQVRFDYVWVP